MELSLRGQFHQGSSGKSFLRRWHVSQYIKLYLFIFGCVGSSLLRVGFLYLRQAGATLRCGAWASHCCGFSCGARALGMQASVVVARGL